MATITRTPHLFCVNCHIVIANQEQHRAHCAVCPNPNVQTIALINQPPACGDDDKGKKKENPPFFWPVTNAGQVMNGGQVMSAGQVVNAGQVINAGQMMNAGQVVNAGQLMNAGPLINAGQIMNCNATKAPSTDGGQKTAGKFGSVRIYGNESVVINNYF